MGKIADNAVIILSAITDNGGKASAAELRELLPDMTNTDRGAAMSLLKSSGKVTSSGATSQIEYRVKSRTRQDAAPSAPKTVNVIDEAADPFELSEKIAAIRVGLRDAGRESAPIDPSIRSDTVYLSVPLLVGVSKEVQLIAALDFLVDDLGLDSPEAVLARATAWLASKYQAETIRL